MSLPFFHTERIGKNVAELGRLRYRDRVALDEFRALRDGEKKINPEPPEYGTGTFSLRIGDFWSGRDEYVWLKKEISLDESWAGKDVVGYFDFGNTGIGNNSSFESLCYLNDKPYQGVDTNHREVFFDLKKTGCEFTVDFRLWSGLEGGGAKQTQYHQIKEAFVAWLDPKTDDLYYLAKNILETLPVLDDSNYYRHALETLIVKAFQLVDFTNTGSDGFYRSVATAADFLNDGVDAFGKESRINVHCVGHTHIDMAWLWRLKHTREKAARSFTTVDRLMERFEEYEFLQTQAQLYDYVKTDFPDIYKRIQARVAEGKWEPSGSMWVEADCNLTSGESLVRQILFGKKFFKKEFNFENTFLWLPDVFGYSWALPQILKKSGIDTFITTKISWSEVNRMPYDTFTWRGIDGSEVLTHFITTPDVCGDTKFYTYNGNILPKIVDGVWKNYRNKDLNQDMLLSYGYGDGGGGVNRDMLENRRRTDRIPGLPSVKTGNVTGYLKTLHATLQDPDNGGYRHVWDNELYLEFHRGTYTSQAYNKKMNRHLELKYRNAEILQVMASVKQAAWGEYPSDGFEAGWKIILRNQFHDIIPGSSIGEVYEDSRIEYAEADEIARGIIESGLGRLALPSKNALTVFNSAGWKRGGYVRVPAFDTGAEHYEDADGNILSAQADGDGAVVYVDRLAPVSVKSLYRKPGKSGGETPFAVTANSVRSPHHLLEWNDAGQLTKIVDRKTGRNALTGPGNLFEIFEDKPRQYDAWELESTIDLKKTTVDDFEGAETVSTGFNFVKIRFAWKYNKSRITQDLVLRSDDARIDFETTVDWQERDTLLKAAFPVDVRSTNARYDIQYGNVERPTHRSTSWDFAKFEVVGHQWADLSEKGFGVALLNDCKYGYDIKDNVMRLSLLKSASFPDPEADRGIQRFTYAIYVHDEAWYDSALVRTAWDLNSPLLAFSGDSGAGFSLFELDNADVMIDAVKKTEDGNRLVIRLHETFGGKSMLDLRLNFTPKGYWESDLMERTTGTFIGGDRIRHQMLPYEIFTVIVDL